MSNLVICNINIVVNSLITSNVMCNFSQYNNDYINSIIERSKCRKSLINTMIISVPSLVVIPRLSTSSCNKVFI